MFLAATLQDVDRVLQCIEHAGSISAVLAEFIDAGHLDGEDPSRKPKCSLATHKSAYELKLFSLGLTSILFKSQTVAGNLKIVAEQWPVSQLFRALVLSLTKQQRLEQRKFAMA